ncbi:MAG: RNHCP domain-containing protein [Planctomycetes bacterium]|jgi:predicted RNA-binding Zn-ribbon protein involved in translation (DUF1610 family)|nr:RNHCP domain-containing protein [Planctomycetota bacterium]HNZ66513.1 RNHCP domain-containing protein [Planctomycetota bacterium]HON44713.1 RNHCP domain-containing protein [Planctomycetota bacterium]HPY73971.1 RNHCP domain-containing protein [Planctomycetota bacterium]HQA99594.1 RNHCP domain-containing protein [Planctomycetota bacterium]
MRKNTIKINESFQCLECGYQVPPAEKTCRNHCPECLFSLHVDDQVPGDRESDCGGLMEPIKVEKTSKGFVIIHKCQECGYIHRNKTLEDDNWDKIIELTT